MEEEAAAADCGAQFRAAVQVIQGLPRSGSYRPSYEEMLRFYSYYKQATAGRCQGPRPGFWDPIGRYKWDAWHSLGRMSKEEAMVAYVAEMKKVAQKVIDTVPMDETTEEMFGYFEPLYEVIHDMPRPPEAFFKRKRGNQEQTANRSQDDPASSPAPELPKDALPEEQQNGPHVPGGGLAPAPEALEGSQVTSDSEGDVYCDTLELMEPEQAGRPLGLSPDGVRAGPEPPMARGTGQGEQGEGRRGEGRSGAGLAAHGSERAPIIPMFAGPQPGGFGAWQGGSGAGEASCMAFGVLAAPDLWLTGGEQDAESTQGLPAQLDAHVASTVRALQDDMRRVLERLSELETLASAQGDAAGTDPGRPLAPQETSPWPLTVSLRTLLFLIAWPFVTQWLLRRWQGKTR